MLPRRHVLAALLTLLFPLTACAQPAAVTDEAASNLTALDADQLAAALTDMLDGHPTAQRTTVTLKVVDLETGEVLYDRGGDKLLTPASNLKIYTSAAALHLLGPEYRWKTFVRLFGHPIRDGVLHGTFQLLGGGDPMLDTEQLDEIIQSVITETELERIVAGVDVGEPFRHWRRVPLKGPGWMWDDDPDYYNMSIQPLMLNFNTLRVEVQPWRTAGVVPTVRLIPKTDYPVVHLNARTTSGSDSSVQIDRQSFNEDIEVTGAIGVEADAASDDITMHDPSKWIVAVATEMLRNHGVTVEDGTPERNYGVGFGGGEGYYSIYGKPFEGKTLAEAVKHFLKVSENAVGEMLLLKLSETFAPEGEVSWPAGAKVISDWLVNEAGLEEGSFRLVDGSGLSRYNLISADSSIRLLTFMKNESEHFEPFFDGLPVYALKPDAAGDEGETFTHFAGVPLAEVELERVFAKPGGMSGVSTISGYLRTYDGRWLAFSLLGNGYIGSSAPVRDLRDEVWAQLVRYRAGE